MHNKKIVFIGGGTGLSHTVAGFRNNVDNDISVIVSVADDGGSSGEVIKHYNIVPPGDIRKVCLALARNNDLAFALNHRFDSGNHTTFEHKNDNFNGYGHHVGNLLFTAINEQNGNNIFKTIEKFSTLLDVSPTNKVVPAGLSPVILKARLHDGTIISGQSKIQQSYDNKISEIFIESQQPANPYIPAIIKNADFIILSPGSLFTSTIANLLFNNISHEIVNSKAKVIYIANIMTQYGETDQMTLGEHINKIETYMGRKLDLVIIPDTKIPNQIIDHYAENNQFPLDVDNINQPSLYADILQFDNLQIYHDGAKIKQIIESIIND